jgi:benzil reductase ((S)-benzoin forming)
MAIVVTVKSSMGSETLVWVTGGSSGLGASLVRTVPYQDCRVINISRRGNPQADDFLVDLSEPGNWQGVRDLLKRELAAFRGRRTIFVHNAAELTVGTGYAGHVETAAHQAHVLMNAAVPLIIGEAFLAACPPRLDAGLVMLSSTASTSLPVTRAVYGAGKAAVEQWVRTVRQERRLRGSGAWVIAILPGAMDTPGLRAAAATADEEYPRAKTLRDNLANGLMQEPDDVARAIWSVLPPADDGPDVVRVGPSPGVHASEFVR